MAFPGTYNFNYYKGDTYQFRIYPKDSSGALFDLTGYDLNTGAKFTVSTARGAAGVANQIPCTAVIATDLSHIECTIEPGDGNLLNAGTTYVYDVEISKTVSGNSYVYTLLTGTISVTDQVTGATTGGI